MTREAREEFDRLPDSTSPRAVYRFEILVASGRFEEARGELDAIERIDGYVAAHPDSLAALHAKLGDVDDAIRYLETAFQRRHFALVFLGIPPAWDRVQDDPRFQDLLKRIGIVAS